VVDASTTVVITSPLCAATAARMVADSMRVRERSLVSLAKGPARAATTASPLFALLAAAVLFTVSRCLPAGRSRTKPGNHSATVSESTTCRPVHLV
jgi:hypothetical protein